MLIIYLHFDFFLKKKKYDTNGNLVRKKKDQFSLLVGIHSTLWNKIIKKTHSYHENY